MGALCKVNSDCYNTDKAQICAPSPEGGSAAGQMNICTRSCQDRTGCPIGFECVFSPANMEKLCLGCLDDTDCPLGLSCQPAPAGSKSPTPALTCQAVAPVPQGDFGKDCAAQGDAACGAGFFCGGEVLDDPNAYCTKTCQSDADCYANMFCGTTTPGNVPPGMQKRCFLRTQCSSCQDSSQCNAPNSLCIPDDQGKGYCTRPCNMEDNMPCTVQPASGGYLECTDTPKDLANPKVTVSACVPRYGRCHAAGAVCDPCRAHTPSDCQQVNGRSCVQLTSGESICLQECASDADCPMNSNLSQDTTLGCYAFGTDRICSGSPDAVTCWP